MIERPAPAHRPVVVIGSLNLDTVIRVSELPRAGETVIARDVRREPGGKSANQAASAALLGADVALIGLVGADPDGDRLIAAARAHGVDASGVLRAEGEATGAAVVMVDDHGENSIVVASGANASLTAAVVPPELLAAAPVVVLALESPLGAIAEIARRAADAGCRVLVNASPADDLPDDLLDSADVLVVNRGEVESITRLSTRSGDWPSVADALAARGVHNAVITLGPDGAVVLDDSRVSVLPAVPVNAIDTTGCGDAFMGAVAAELAAGKPLVEAARTGVAAGAWAATGSGAQPSFGTRADVETLLSEGRG